MSDGARLADELRGSISDARVLAAIAALPRERFVTASEQGRAYENRALPIDCGQTISQPLVVGRMLELLALGPEDLVLDVGTGSGYHAALLARLAGRVWTIERHAELAAQAQRTLQALGIGNVEVVVGDGFDGLPAHAPYDAINVAAAIEEGLPGALLAQLAPGGRMVAPVGEGTDQHLVLARRGAAGIEQRQLEPVRFVPLIRGGND